MKWKKDKYATRNKKKTAPLFKVQFYLFILSFFVFVYLIGRDTLTSYSSETSQAAAYSFLFCVFNLCCFIGFTTPGELRTTSIIGNLAIMGFMVPSLMGYFGGPEIIPTITGIIKLGLVILGTSFLPFLMWGKTRYLFMSGIYIGLWAILSYSYIVLAIKHGFLYTLNYLFTNEGLQVFVQYSWVSILIAPLFFLLIPRMYGVKQQKPGGGSNYNGSLANETPKKDWYMESLEQSYREREELELQSDYLRNMGADRSEIDTIDDQLGRGAFDRKWEDDKHQYKG